MVELLTLVLEKVVAVQCLFGHSLSATCSLSSLLSLPCRKIIPAEAGLLLLKNLERVSSYFFPRQSFSLLQSIKSILSASPVGVSFVVLDHTMISVIYTHTVHGPTNTKRMQFGSVVRLLNYIQVP